PSPWSTAVSKPKHWREYLPLPEPPADNGRSSLEWGPAPAAKVAPPKPPANNRGELWAWGAAIIAAAVLVLWTVDGPKAAAPTKPSLTATARPATVPATVASRAVRPREHPT